MECSVRPFEQLLFAKLFLWRRSAGLNRSALDRFFVSAWLPDRPIGKNDRFEGERSSCSEVGIGRHGETDGDFGRRFATKEATQRTHENGRQQEQVANQSGA